MLATARFGWLIELSQPFLSDLILGHKFFLEDSGHLLAQREQFVDCHGFPVITHHVAPTIDRESNRLAMNV